MNSTRKSANQIEELGIFFEKFHIPPVPSRVLAYLLTIESQDLSFNEIQDFLQTSRSSLNNALKWLIKDGRIEYYTKAGDRTKYYKINPQSWVMVMQERVKAWGTSTKLIEKALKNRIENTTDPTDFTKGLAYIIEFETFLQEKWDEYFDHWNNTISYESYLEKKGVPSKSR